MQLVYVARQYLFNCQRSHPHRCGRTHMVYSNFCRVEPQEEKLAAGQVLLSVFRLLPAGGPGIGGPG